MARKFPRYFEMRRTEGFVPKVFLGFFRPVLRCPHRVQTEDVLNVNDLIERGIMVGGKA
jgi:hypothetical protein